jgi:hypothetical protein
MQFILSAFVNVLRKLFIIKKLFQWSRRFLCFKMKQSRPHASGFKFLLSVTTLRLFSRLVEESTFNWPGFTFQVIFD